MYDLVFLLSSDVSSDKMDKIANDIVDSLNSDSAGSLVLKEYRGIKELAYNIKGKIRAHYYYMVLDIHNKSWLRTLEKYMRDSNDILRHQIYSSKKNIEDYKQDRVADIFGADDKEVVDVTN